MLAVKTVVKCDTYSDEAGQKVCKNIISHQACSQDQLLGLVITRQLRMGEKSSRVLIRYNLKICQCALRISVHKGGVYFYTQHER